MHHDMNCPLWPKKDEVFFRNRDFRVILQNGPRCVPTSLAILTGAKPEDFQGVVNTQDPLSWSDGIGKWDMQLAYCPTDVRKLKFYLPVLLQLDDLFTLSYFTESNMILGDPDQRGWICGSHVVVMHRDKILDPAQGVVTKANDHPCGNFHTKRIFRVVSKGHARSL